MVTFVSSLGANRGVSTATSTSGGATDAASATTARQNRSNDAGAASRKRHVSSAPLAIARPAPTGTLQIAGRTTGLSVDAGTVLAMTMPPSGSGVGHAISVASSRDAFELAPAMAVDSPVDAVDHDVVPKSRSYGPGDWRSRSKQTVPPRRRMKASSPLTSRSVSSSGAPTTTASNSASEG